MQYEIHIAVVVHILDMPPSVFLLGQAAAEPHALGINGRGVEVLRGQDGNRDDSFAAGIDGVGIAARLDVNVNSLPRDSRQRGTLVNPINTDENDQIVAADFEVWTGTVADGTGGGVGTCTVWTTNAVGTVARIGFADATDQNWSDWEQGGKTCDELNRLYCFSDFEVPVELEEFSVE